MLPNTRDGATSLHDPPPSTSARTRSILTIVAAVTFTVAAVLPSFLLGGLASLVRADLGFDEAGLGVAVGSFYGASALTAIPGGRLAERLRARRSMLLGLALSVTSLLLIALVARTWWQLVVGLVVAGASNGVTQSGASLAIAEGVPQRRLGLAFAVKHSAVPVSSLLAGLAVPLIGLTIGWRWAFGIAAIAAVALLAILPASASTRSGPVREPREGVRFTSRERRGLIVVAVASGLGAVAANAMGAFFVESAVSRGHDLALSGLLLSLGSVTGIMARMSSGWLADRLSFDPLKAVGTMMVLGTSGFLLLAHGRGLGLLIVATLVAFAAGWGWPGLMQMAVVSEHLHAPGAASGIAHAGALTGGLVGPVVFGWVVSEMGYTVGWTMVAGAALVGGLMLLYERRGSARFAAANAEV